MEMIRNNRIINKKLKVLKKRNITKIVISLRLDFRRHSLLCISSLGFWRYRAENVFRSLTSTRFWKIAKNFILWNVKLLVFLSQCHPFRFPHSHPLTKAESLLLNLYLSKGWFFFHFMFILFLFLWKCMISYNNAIFWKLLGGRFDLLRWYFSLNVLIHFLMYSSLCICLILAPQESHSWRGVHMTVQHHVIKFISDWYSGLRAHFGGRFGWRSRLVAAHFALY